MNGVTGTSNSKSRLTGLSGFDTESIIEQLMKAERTPLNSLYQKRTIVEWRRDAYRDITTSLKGFKNTFFDITNRSSYMLSKSSIKTMDAQTTSSYFSVSASSEAQAGSTSVKVIKLATADTAITDGSLSKPITGTIAESPSFSGTALRVSLDGITKDITLSEPGAGSNIGEVLQAALDNAFGSGKLQVGYIQGEGQPQVTIGTIGGATKVTVGNPSSGVSALPVLGLSQGSSNRVSLNSSLEDLKNLFNVPLNFSDSDTVEFTINGKLVTAKASDTLSSVFDKINRTAEANVTITYDELTDKVKMTSNQLGDGDNLSFSDTNGNLLHSLGLLDQDNNITEMRQGQDAVLSVGGQQIVRASNNITVNGVTYTLNAAHPEAATGDTVTISQGIDKAYDNIKKFVEKYNELVDQLNGKISEKYDRDFQPLTDEQKESMKEEDIEKWEKKAKTGLLKNDDILQKLVGEMRTALYEKVEGVGITLNDIGISSLGYTAKGKLTIDEDKLKNALKTKSDDVAKLLNGVDPDNPTYRRTMTADQKQSRYNKSGVLQRVSDLIEDNISTIRDSHGNKGVLLEKAGIDGDLTNTDNLIQDELDRYNSRISTLVDVLTQKEENYYKKFSKLETMMNKMNAQSSWLTSQFSSGQ